MEDNAEKIRQLKNLCSTELNWHQKGIERNRKYSQTSQNTIAINYI